MLIRSDERFRSEHNGILSLHCFSAGPHYDSDRLGVGALIGFDDHTLAPGAGFAEHAHRAVDIVSWVVAGALRHVGATGEIVVTPGRALVQACGDGVRHAEFNASDREPLRLVQMTFVGAAGDAAVHLAEPPVDLAQGRFGVVRASARHVQPPCFVHVLAGSATVDDIDLAAGDSVAPERPSLLTAHGEVLLWTLRNAGGDDPPAVAHAVANAARPGRTRA